MKIAHHGIECKIRFRHHRFPEPIRIVSKRYSKPIERWVQGYTKVEMFAHGLKIAHAGAWCSWEDEFDPEVGRKQAFRHLLEDWRFTREERREMWQGYWKVENARRLRNGEAVVGEAVEDSGEDGEAGEVLLPPTGEGVPLEQTGEDSAA